MTPPGSRGYRRYVLGSLMLVNAIIVLDRGLMGLLLEPIKEELHLSDANLGFLTGIAFGLFYAALGIPIARWADRGNRVTIVSAALSLWAATVMLYLFVTSFLQLVVARVAAAVGEAGGMPPTYSLIGDYFPAANERTRAMTVYALADPLAVLVSFVLGGWLNERFGWRIAFASMGVPALFIALLVRMSVAEPRSRASRRTPESPPSLREAMVTLWRQPTTRHLILGIILLFTVGLGLGPWEAAFLMRTHGLNTTELGRWLGVIFSFGGMGGVAAGGYVAARWFAEEEASQLRFCATLIALQVPCLVAFLLLPGSRGSLVALIPAVATFNAIFGPTFALLQRLVPDEIRATTMAVVMLLANLIGMGVGPQSVGLLSDLLEPALKVDSLRYAMLAISSVAFWSAYHFWRAGHSVGQDLVAVRVQDRGSVAWSQAAK